MSSQAVMPLPQELPRISPSLYRNESVAEDSLSRAHRMPFGAEVTPEGAVRFRLYAPAVESVRLVIEGNPEPVRMLPLEDRMV